MATDNYPILAAEGRVFMLIALVCSIGATWLWGYSAIWVWLSVVFVGQFFRDPPRQISTVPGAVVAPASGQVVEIVSQPNPYLSGATSWKISIFMNIFSVHSNLIPIAGTVMSCEHHAGRFFNAALDKASHENERNAVWIQTPQGEDVVSVQIAGLIARRILCYVERNQRVHTGERYGFIRFGSRVDLYLPPTAELNVRLGQWVNSGDDVLGYLPRPTP